MLQLSGWHGFLNQRLQKCHELLGLLLHHLLVKLHALFQQLFLQLLVLPTLILDWNLLQSHLRMWLNVSHIMRVSRLRAYLYLRSENFITNRSELFVVRISFELTYIRSPSRNSFFRVWIRLNPWCFILNLLLSFLLSFFRYLLQQHWLLLFLNPSFVILVVLIVWESWHKPCLFYLLGRFCWIWRIRIHIWLTSSWRAHYFSCNNRLDFRVFSHLLF